MAEEDSDSDVFLDAESRIESSDESTEGARRRRGREQCLSQLAVDRQAQMSPP